MAEVTIKKFEVAPSGTADIVDELGRKITIKKLTVGDRMRLSKAVGNQNANESYFGYAFIVASVTMIDGVPVAPPNTQMELEKLADRLGDEGIIAVSSGITSTWPSPTKEEVVTDAKN